MKTVEVTYNDTTLKLKFRVASFAVRKQLREIEKNYSDLLMILDKNIDLANLDLSDISAGEFKQITETTNYATALSVLVKLIPKNPEFVKTITNSDWTIDLREQKDKFYLEVFVLAVDTKELNPDIADNFNSLNIFENEFLTSLDMAEVGFVVQQFRQSCK